MKFPKDQKFSNVKPEIRKKNAGLRQEEVQPLRNCQYVEFFIFSTL